MYSVRLKIDSEHPRHDDTCRLFLQVIINRKKVRVGLDLTWPADRFDENGGCKPRMRQDPDVDTYNIVINNARAKCNAIFREYHLRDVPLTVETFLKEFNSTLDKRNFAEYFGQKSLERWTKRLIEKTTYKTEQSTLSKLKEFNVSLRFSDFTPTWPFEFDRFLRKVCDVNTRWAHHKKVKTYLALARDVDNIKFVYPYTNFKASQTKGKWRALSKSQLQKLLEYYFQFPLPIAEKTVLRKFLFSCFTGLRLSDLQKLTADNFRDGRMTVRPSKTDRYGIEINNVPLNELAIALLEDEKKFQKNGKYFALYSGQYANRKLKQIAQALNIDHNIHFHVGRSTFASMYDQAGGNHRSLLEYMGLTKMETLMKYVQTNQEVISESIGKMNLTFSSASARV